MKLKPQRNTNIHLLEQLKLKLVTVPNADKDTGKLDHSDIADGNVNDTATLKTSLTFS